MRTWRGWSTRIHQALRRRRRPYADAKALGEGALLRRCLREQQRVSDEIGVHIERLQQPAALSDRFSAHCSIEALHDLMIRRSTLARIVAQGSRHHPLFVFSSWLLRDAFQICTRTPDEGMVYVLGIDIDGVLVSTGLFECAYSHRSFAGAGSDHSASHRLGVEAMQNDHRIMAIAHSHPGRGVHATHPSGTDLRTHAMWELTGPVVGGIFCRSGYLRWFSAGRLFEIRVIGNHLREVGDGVWQVRGQDQAEQDNEEPLALPERVPVPTV